MPDDQIALNRSTLLSQGCAADRYFAEYGSESADLVFVPVKERA